MNSVLESSYTWIYTFFESFATLICEVSNLIITSLGISLNSTDSESSSSSNSDSNTVDSEAKTQSIIPQVLQEAASFFAFDDFQYLLLQIFLAILLGNICLILIAWHIYGTRITERFMTPNSSSQEEVKEGISKLKLPREHSQQYF